MHLLATLVQCHPSQDALSFHSVCGREILDCERAMMIGPEIIVIRGNTDRSTCIHDQQKTNIGRAVEATWVGQKMGMAGRVLQGNRHTWVRWWTRHGKWESVQEHDGARVMAVGEQLTIKLLMQADRGNIINILRQV